MYELRFPDYLTSDDVDHLIAIFEFVAQRIWKTYRRQAKVIYPPVQVAKLDFQEQQDNNYLAISRMLSYKKIDSLVSTFNQLPDKQLVVIGDGADLPKIKRMAGINIEILG